MGLALMTGRVACAGHTSRPRPWEQPEPGPAGSCLALRGIRDWKGEGWGELDFSEPGRHRRGAFLGVGSLVLGMRRGTGSSALAESPGVPRPNPSGLRVTVAVVAAAPCRGTRLCWALPGATAPWGASHLPGSQQRCPSAIVGQLSPAPAGGTRRHSRSCLWGRPREHLHSAYGETEALDSSPELGRSRRNQSTLTWAFRPDSPPPTASLPLFPEGAWKSVFRLPPHPQVSAGQCSQSHSHTVPSK